MNINERNTKLKNKFKWKREISLKWLRRNCLRSPDSNNRGECSNLLCDRSLDSESGLNIETRT